MLCISKVEEMERLTSSSAISANRSGVLRALSGGVEVDAVEVVDVAAAELVEEVPFVAAVALAAASGLGLLLLRRRGRVMNFGRGRASRSRATFVAA